MGATRPNAGGFVADYMRYQGRAVEVYGWTPSGQAVPQLYPGDQGEKQGDFAILDDIAMEWDGKSWVASPWRDFAVWKKAAS
jgi:hypothetical protein